MRFTALARRPRPPSPSKSVKRPEYSPPTLISNDKRQSRRICYREFEHEFDSYSPVDFGAMNGPQTRRVHGPKVPSSSWIARSQRGSYRGSRTFAVRPNFTPSSRGLILGLYTRYRHNVIFSAFVPRLAGDPGERASRSSPLHTRIVPREFPGESRARRAAV